MSKIRVLIADDHPVVRAGLRMLIDAQGDMEVAEEVGSAAGCVDRALASRPEIILLDISMPGGSGVEAIERLRKAGSASRVLVLTMHGEPAVARAALAAGASGYVTKEAASSEILTAIRTLHRGRSYIAVPVSDSGAGAVFAEASEAPRPSAKRADPVLSEREQAVLRLVAEGYTSKEAAVRLHLSVKTVESYRARFVGKLGLRRRADLFRYALEAGILPSGTEPTS